MKKDNFGNTALHVASFNGHHDCIMTLLDHGSDLNQKDNDGLTALHLVSIRDYYDCMVIMLILMKKIG